MQSKKAYELVTTGEPDTPAFPHAVVLTVSFVISPVIGLCCHRRFACAKLDASVEAPGPHDFAVRVQPRSSAVPNSVHRIPPRVRDDRERPLVGRDGAIRKVFRLGEEARYFFGLGWTGDLRNSLTPRHCERSEAIQLRTTKLDCFVASLLAMTKYGNDHECATPSRGGVTRYLATQRAGNSCKPKSAGNSVLRARGRCRKARAQPDLTRHEALICRSYVQK